MAKKEKVNMDKKLVEGIRRGCLGYISRMIKSQLKEETVDSLHDKFQMIKDSYVCCKDEYIEEKLSHMEYCTFINYIQDVYIAGLYSPDKVTPMLKAIKDKIIEPKKSKGSEWDFFVCVNRIGVATDVAMGRKGMISYINDITMVIMLYSIYITTYLTKIKNRLIYDLYDDGDIIKARFSSTTFLTNEEVNNLCNFSEYNRPKNIHLTVQKLVSEYDVKSSDYSVGEIAKEYLSKETVGAAFRIKGYMGEFPFANYDESVISVDKLNKLPNDRLYVIPSAGVRFEFFDKTKNIDSLEMKESKGRVLFCVNLVNSSCLYYSTGVCSDDNLTSESIDSYRYTKDIFKMIFMVPVEILKDDIDLNKIVLDSKYVTFTPIITNDKERSQFAKIVYTCLCCMYAAYYNPKMFSDTFKMYTINRKEKGGYNREESFRIAHLRKLPKGYNMSKEASDLAKKFGFNYIPKGYTFVRASNVDKEPDDKKIIKVNNI